MRRCVTKIKQKVRVMGDGGEEVYTEVELMSKDAALQAAMKHLQLFGQDASMPGAVGIDLSALLARLEERRNNTVDGDVIKRAALEGPE